MGWSLPYDIPDVTLIITSVARFAAKPTNSSPVHVPTSLWLTCLSNTVVGLLQTQAQHIHLQAAYV